MSKQYQHSFESIQSPLSGPGGFSNPVSPVGGNGQPPSFKTNINRAKTKKWVEAKGYSYDGDDWGDVDEYDEYGGYDGPQAPPVPAVPPMPSLPKQPTGLRQKGQSVASAHSSPKSEQTGFSSGAATPGGPKSMGQQQQYNAPMASVVQQKLPAGRPRANSFEQGDDAIVMPSSSVHPAGAWEQIAPSGTESQPRHAAGQPASSASSTRSTAAGEVHVPSHTEQRPPSLRIETQVTAQKSTPQLQTMSPKHATNSPSPSVGSHRAISDADRRQPSGTASRTQSMDSNTPSVDFQSRREFSPSLSTHQQPASNSTSPNPNEFRFPPRKSSLSQRTASWNRTPRPYDEASQSLPQSPGSEKLQSPISEPAGSTIKPLTFVRPADIYKRIEAERERERRSLDSGRPSLDSVRSRSSEPERVTSPPLRERLSSESLGRSLRGRQNYDGMGDLENSRRLRPMLDPVKERKSEYGFEGFSIEAAKTAEGQQPQNLEVTSSAAGERSSKPILPDVNRISGFGDSLFGPALASEDFDTDKQEHPAKPSVEPVARAPVVNATNEKSLAHQPSLGFRSVVNQAFDRTDDHSVPPTPSSADRSDIQRSGSQSTTGISPIMSRAPDVASLDAKAREMGPMQPEMEAIEEETIDLGGASRPTSTPPASSLRDALRTPPPPAHAHDATETLPRSFVPGHRRDLSTPSPGNSPARSLALESAKAVTTEEQAEITAATPTEAQPMNPSEHRPGSTSQSSVLDEVDIERPENISSLASNVAPHKREVNGFAPAPSEYSASSEVNIPASKHQSFETSPSRQPRSPTFSASPRSGSESPSKGRVRDLAGMFDMNERSSRRGSAASISSRGSIGLAEKPKDSTDTTRPAPNRLESFRPSLPGGWVSFSTMAEHSPSRVSLVADDAVNKAADQKEESPNQENASGSEEAPEKSSEQGLDAPAISHEEDAATVEGRDPEQTAFAAAAAAGAAMGASIADTVRQLRERGGFDSTSPSDYGRNEHTDTSLESSIHGPVVPQVEIKNDGDDGDFHQGSDVESPNDETTSPAQHLLSASDVEHSGYSSVGPTPPPKDTPYQPESAESDYFPPTLPLKHRSINPAVQPPLLNPNIRPEILPSLSTDTSPQDLESDRLRKEIVRRLSPSSTSEQLDVQDLEAPEGASNGGLSTFTKSFDPGRESTFLPSEYDSYWDHGERDDLTSGSRTPPARTEHDLHPVELEGDHPAEPLQEQILGQEEHGRSAATEATDATSGGMSGPPLLKKKFSWEEDSPPQSPEQTHFQPPVYSSHGEQVGTPEVIPSNDNRVSFQSMSTLVPYEQQVNAEQASASRNMSFSKGEPPATSEYRLTLPPYDEIVNVADGVEPDTASSEAPYPSRLSTSTSVPETRPSASRPTSAALEHSYATNAAPVPGDQENLTPAIGASEATTQPLQSNPPHKILAFREIMALENQSDRIRAYNEARKQLAEMDTGLDNWIASMVAANPEYVEELSINRESGQPTGSTTKRSGSSIQGPSYTSGSIRTTGHHMQNKGKDLLHSAGALGGRANIAAKGLFSKGRNKLRGSSTEKDTHASLVAGGENSASSVPSQPSLASQQATHSNFNEQETSATNQAQEDQLPLHAGGREDSAQGHVKNDQISDQAVQSPLQPTLSPRGRTIRAVQPELADAHSSFPELSNTIGFGDHHGPSSRDDERFDAIQPNGYDLPQRSGLGDNSVQQDNHTGEKSLHSVPRTFASNAANGRYSVQNNEQNYQTSVQPYQMPATTGSQEASPNVYRGNSIANGRLSRADRSSYELNNADQHGSDYHSSSPAPYVLQQQNQGQFMPSRPLHPRQHSTENNMPGFGASVDDMRAESRRRSIDLLRQFGGGSPIYLDRRDSSGSTWSTSSKAAMQRKRRSSFFGLLNKPSSPEVPHGSRDSAVAHLANSKAEPGPASPPPIVQAGNRGSFQQKSPIEKKGRNRLQRSSIIQTAQAPDDKKKKRFSGLSAIFGRSESFSKQESSPVLAEPNVLVKRSHTRRNRESQALTQRQAQQLPPLSKEPIPHPSGAGYGNWSAEQSATALTNHYHEQQPYGQTHDDRRPFPDFEPEQKDMPDHYYPTSHHAQSSLSGYEQPWPPSNNAQQVPRSQTYNRPSQIAAGFQQTEQPWQLDLPPLPSSPLDIHSSAEGYYQHPARTYHYLEDPQYHSPNTHQISHAGSVSPLNAPVPGAGPVGPLSIEDPLTKVSSGSPSPIQELPGVDYPHYKQTAAYPPGVRI